MEWFDYLAKASLVLAVVYITYWLLFRYDTFLHLKRWVLLAGLMLSACLPLVQIAAFQTPVAVDSSQAIAIPVEYWLLMRQSAAEATQDTFSWQQIGLVAYGLVAGVLLLRLLANLIRLAVFLRRLHFQPLNPCALAESEKIQTPFSFFHFILLPQIADAELRQQILVHEHAHASEYHTIDVLLSELYLVFFWFNPVAWLYRRQLRLNLEHLADAVALQQADAYQYQLNLLKISTAATQFSLVNHFHFSSLKQRIVMINRANSSLQAGLKYIALPVVILGLVSLFHLSCMPEIKPNTQEDNISEDYKSSREDFFQTSKAIFILDGERVTGKETKKLDPSQIASMTILKGEDATSIYGEEGKNGVILITSKSNTSGIPASTLFIVDGRKLSKEEVDKIDPETIESISVFHDNPELVRKKYGEKTQNGVLEITLKKKK